MASFVAAGALAMGAAAPAGAVTVACSPADSYSKAVLSDAPVAYYRLDDSGSTMCESSTQANNGTYGASGLTQGQPGALLSSTDTSLSANGTSGVIGASNANAPLSGNSSFTFEGWVKSPTSARNQALVDVGQVGNGNVAGLATWSNQSGTTASSLVLDEYQGWNDWDTLASGVNLYDGNWHYLVITYNASTSKLTGYADGHNLGNQTPDTSSHAFSLSASPVRVGKWVDTVINQAWSGGADDVAVYAKALTGPRVLAHYKAAGYGPTVTQVTPNAGSPFGGNTVTIFGSNFTPAAKVKFGTVAATAVNYLSSTELQAQSPAEPAGTVKLTVSTYVGSGSGYFAYGSPAVSGISPSSGPPKGGTTVIITGSGFVPGATVAFGSTPAKKVMFVSPTEIKAVSPAGSGSVDVTVSNAWGQSSTVPADTFTYAVAS